ncbi:RNA helicase [Thioalkalivibrio denitrificans]|uniref:DEAD-box ATP-dependent RNA helicase RhpA n=1 Tax=Thioalkalivibrio denitrificans TaxID=108003 RepID=A0A1V3NFR4_9GAMM|nr:DEAD/DEAH box helicase [Thioalkalivibrio denitrificans]OOG23626.1 RNA helicase [Thioalkalivibrio denitrificans]
MSSVSRFADLGLADPLLRAISEAGYETPTPIQSQAIPLVLEGRDLLAAAQTGTGKTAGFTLPILHLLSSRSAQRSGAGRPRCLVLTPTRELAAQVHDSVLTYGRHLKLRSTAIFGGVNINPQFRTLRGQIDIVVATPGRLLDHVGQKTVDLSGVEILVLDEADRMLDMGFIPDIRRILGLLPATRQSLLFSATFSDEIRALAGGMLNDPARVEVAARNTASELVQQHVHLVHTHQKRDLLSHLIRENRWDQVLVFTRTKHGANKLAEKLSKDGIPAAAIHGNKSQAQRTKALHQFKSGRVPVLVATDIAARGLDIDQLPQVVNFELPNVPEDYVHRIGRTGRAGSAGAALSLVDGEEMRLLSGIERLLRRPIERIETDGFDAPPPANDSPNRSARGFRPAGNGARRNQPRNGRPRSASNGAGRPGRSKNGNVRTGSGQGRGNRI